MKDCAGTCGQSELDDCDICQLKGSKAKRKFKDCNGICFGKSTIDKCGICSGDKTDKIPNNDLDTCGVCFGNGSTCAGCDGEVNSGKLTDVCGNCYHPDDPLYNAECMKISSLSPRTSPAKGGQEIIVRGAGFHSDASCSFTGASTFKAIRVTGKYRSVRNYYLTSNLFQSGIYYCIFENIL